MSNLRVVRHLGFDQKWIFTISQLLGTHIALVYQISTQSGNIIDDLANFCGWFFFSF